MKNQKLLFRLFLISVFLNVVLLIPVFLCVKYIYSSQPKYANMFTDLLPTHIVVIGDSRAANGNWVKGLGRMDIRNCGIGGDLTANLVKNLNYVYQLKPRLCIIQIGINDIMSGEKNEKTKGFYVQIIDSLLIHKIRPVVTSIIPIIKNMHSETLNESVVNARADSLNNQLLAICKSKKITYININKKITENNRLKRVLTVDGVHLTNEGYTLVYNEIKPYIN